MSMVRCDSCDAYMDSDDDPDCFVEVGNMRAQTKDYIWCESCRDRKAEEAEREEPAGLQAFIDKMEAERQECPDCGEVDCETNH